MAAKQFPRTLDLDSMLRFIQNRTNTLSRLYPLWNKMAAILFFCTYNTMFICIFENMH